jgi:AcrR family transcriptional regulator
MARQAERREATRGAILAAAQGLFETQGFAAATMDEIAAAAGVAKGAVYHHFASKEALFEAVFEAASAALAARLMTIRGKDILDSLVAGSRAYFAACAEPALGRIILKDGPAVLGWERWREIDMRHFGASMPMALQAAMSEGLIATQPAEPLARLIMGAVTEAAVACAASDDPARTGAEHVVALEAILEGLRTRRPA